MMIPAPRTLTASIPAILNGLAEEMSRLAAHGLQLESSMARLSRGRIDGEIIEDLQSLDVLLQNLLELRCFMVTLAEGAQQQDNLSIDRALEALKLGALQTRLASAIGQTGITHSVAPSGDCEFFE